MQGQSKGTYLLKWHSPLPKFFKSKYKLMHFVIGYLIIAAVWWLFLYCTTTITAAAAMKYAFSWTECRA